MNALGYQLKRAQEWLNQRPPRERGAIIAAGLAVVAYILYMFLLAPQNGEQNRLREKAQELQQQTDLLRKQVSEIQQSYGQTVDASGQARLEALRAQLKATDPALAEVARALVSPKEMASLVEQALRQNRALEVVSIENLPATPLTESLPAPADAAGTGTPAPEAAAAEGGFYKHGMAIEVRGRYTDIVSYLRALENLPWKVFWGQVTLVAEDYPKSRVRLVVYTLSLDPKWIGI
jgi:MSHA biogenesis protein MshJ